MVRMISHEEAADLLGAYALDAVDADEAEAVEEHLRTCPRCRDELRNHREVAGLLAYAGQEAPAGLWDRVSAGMHEPLDTDATSASVPAPDAIRIAGSVEGGRRPVGLGAGTGGGGVASGVGAGRGAGRRSRVGAGLRVGAGRGAGRGAGSGVGAGRRVGSDRGRRLRTLPSLAAAAAVLIVALLGVEVVRLQDRTDHLSGQIRSMAGTPSMTTVQHAIATPGARTVVLRPVHGSGPSLDAVILPDGQGYLYRSQLEPLSSSETYQLWGVVGVQRISYGVLGSNLATVTPFRASQGVQALAVTAEVAGGVVTSTNAPVAVGLLS